jgi:HEAT repeat protein
MLTDVRPGDELETVEKLWELIEEHPGYFALYEDVAWFAFAGEDHAAALKALCLLAERSAAHRDDPVHRKKILRVARALAEAARRIEELEPLLESGDADLRERAIVGAGGISYDESLSLLVRLARDPVPEIRVRAVAGLGAGAYHEGAEVVLAATKDADPRVRASAAVSLRRLAGDDSTGPLVELLMDPELYVRETAADQLRTLSGKSFFYDPAAPPEERREGVRRWEKWAKER